uniref:Reverse transcriptase Ty1/copia-type domain-containing protein n=1 Tax=Tanacetum cinerariifolium TaxID=118510 RepID=A0A6L2NRM7_TANCI|nr:hypothetical protein [Tanacetum cinerariifolium]
MNVGMERQWNWTNKVNIAMIHVTFDETQFPYKSMAPSSLSSYQFLEPMPSSSLLHHSLLDPTKHTHNLTVDPQPNTPAPLIIDPTQSPPHISPNSPGLTFPTNQPTSHEPHNTQTQTQTQNSLLPPPIFYPPNPKTNTDPVNEPPRTHPMITVSQSGIVKPIDRLASVNMVRSMWLFKHKFHADGTLSRYKARLVANDRSQQLGVDFDETFSPVVKPATIRMVLSLVVSRKWPIHQLDVNNAFLNEIFIWTETSTSCLVLAFCRLCHTGQFYHSRYDSSLFIYRHESQVAYLLLYVDDFILTASSTALLHHLIDSLHCKFDMTDLEALNYFLVDTESKLGLDGVSIQDPTLYRSLAGGLQYLTFTRPDLSYAVQQICLYMHDPQEPHLAALKRILRYYQGTLDLGLHLYASPTTSLVGYTDADWAGCPSTHMSTLETEWLHNLLHELHSPLSTATRVYCDNVSAVYMSDNPVQHQWTKHIEINIHFVQNMVTAGQVRVLHVPSHFQYADIFTKGLPSTLFEEF